MSSSYGTIIIEASIIQSVVY
eukprot:SAG11_NODE_24131_length_376_cov_3.586331_1_plen_20_part_10